MKNEFGLFIHSLRKKNYLTQGQLADLMGVSHQAVSNWERGESLPDVSLILSLAEILDTTAERLLFMMCGKYTNKAIEDFIKKRKEMKNNE